MQTHTLTPRGPFSLGHARDFLCGFTPASGSSRVVGGGLDLAFLLDTTWEPVVASVTARGGLVDVCVGGASDPGAAVRQVARILSLDHDATAFAALGERDPVVGRLLAASPGFRPVCFASPFEAAVWGVLAQRVPMTMAARLRRSIAEGHGSSVTLGALTFAVFPSPARLLDVAAVPGVPAEKLRRLHGLARAALDGRLDAATLRGLPPQEALEQLKTLPGVGEWTAQHILYRGTGAADGLPTAEPRVLRALALAQGRDATASPAELARVSEAWRPFRMWVFVLMVAGLAKTPGWHGPERRGRTAAA